MSAADKIQVLFFQKLLDDVLAENIGDASFILAPAFIIIRTHLIHIGVGPQQVTHESLIRHLSWSLNLFYLFDRSEFRTQASVHA